MPKTRAHRVRLHWWLLVLMEAVVLVALLIAAPPLVWKVLTSNHANGPGLLVIWLMLARNSPIAVVVGVAGAVGLTFLLARPTRHRPPPWLMFIAIAPLVVMVAGQLEAWLTDSLVRRAVFQEHPEFRAGEEAEALNPGEAAAFLARYPANDKLALRATALAIERLQRDGPIRDDDAAVLEPRVVDALQRIHTPNERSALLVAFARIELSRIEPGGVAAFLRRCAELHVPLVCEPDAGFQGALYELTTSRTLARLRVGGRVGGQDLDAIDAAAREVVQGSEAYCRHIAEQARLAVQLERAQ